MPIRKHSKYLSGSHLASVTHRRDAAASAGKHEPGTNRLCYGNRRAQSPRRHARKGECDGAGPARGAHARPKGRAARPCVHRTRPVRGTRACRGRAEGRRSSGLQGGRLDGSPFSSWHQNETGAGKRSGLQGPRRLLLRAVPIDFGDSEPFSVQSLNFHQSGQRPRDVSPHRGNSTQKSRFGILLEGA